VNSAGNSSKKRWILGCVLVLGTLSVPVRIGANAEAVAPFPAATAGDPTSRYIVAFDASGDRLAVSSMLSVAGVKAHHEFHTVLDGVAVSLTEAQVEALRADPRVASITPDSILTLASTEGDLPESGDVIPGRFIVQASPSATVGARARILDVIGDGLETTLTRALTGYVAELSDGEVAQLRDNPNVVAVEPDRIVSVSTSQVDPTWGLDRIDQAGVDLNRQFNYVGDGSGVKAYVIDSGISSHPDLGGRILPGFAATGLFDTTDGNGHGTHVAGTIGGTTWGVAKNVDLVPVRVLNSSGLGSVASVIEGINWVIADHASNERAVANLSLGGSASTSIDAAVNNLVADGVVVVVAAGNSNVDACNSSPARVAAAVTVAATTSSDSRASYSNFGSCVDLFAPGSGITSTWLNRATNVLSGTSMATPHVAGALASYWSRAENQSKTAAQVASGLIGLATSGKITNRGFRSPDRLLYLPPPVGQSPGQPTDVLAAEISRGVRVSWTPPAALGSGAISSYVATATSGDVRCVANGTDTSCSITGIAKGTYQFEVRALNFYGASAFSVSSDPIDLVGLGNNDFFAGRLALNSSGEVLDDSNVSATREDAEPLVDTTGTFRTLWYSFTPVEDGSLAIDLNGSQSFGSPLDTVLAVYTGTALGSLELVKMNDDENLSQGIVTSKLTAPVVAGVEYIIQVGSFSDIGGSIHLDASFIRREPPRSPTAVMGVPGNGRISVSWTAPSVDADLVKSYVATALPGGRQCEVAAPSTTCVISSLVNGTAYSLSVVAVNSAGFSAPATAEQTVTPVEGPTGARRARTWALDRIDQRSKTGDGVYSPPADGQDVRLYIVDTGIRASHQEFAGRVGTGVSTVEGDTSTDDCHGHGTHVASSAAGSSYGVASQATIIPVRVFGCQRLAYASSVIEGLDWIVDDVAERGAPSVATIAFSGVVGDSALDSAVEALVGQGIAVVVAAGNDSRDACSTSPARIPAAITVGAATVDDEASAFSNFGSCVDLFSAGSKVPGAGLESSFAEEIASGTSPAASQVAGYVAVVRGLFPILTPSEVAKVIVNNATTDALSGVPVGTPNRLLYVGSARCSLADQLDVNCASGARNLAAPVKAAPSVTLSTPPVVQTPSVVVPSVITFATGRARFVEMKRSPTRAAASAPRVTVTRDVPVALRVPGLPRRSQPTVNVKSRHGSVVLGKVKVTKTGVLRLPKLSFSKTGVYTFSFKVGKRTLFAKVSVVRPVQPKVLSQRTVTVVQ
jgi:subtilisin family serine protease